MSIIYLPTTANCCRVQEWKLWRSDEGGERERERERESEEEEEEEKQGRKMGKAVKRRKELQ